MACQEDLEYDGGLLAGRGLLDEHKIEVDMLPPIWRSTKFRLSRWPLTD